MVAEDILVQYHNYQVGPGLYDHNSLSIQTVSNVYNDNLGQTFKYDTFEVLVCGFMFS